MTNIDFVSDEINTASASEFISRIGDLPPRSAAHVFMSTYGGDIFAGGEMKVAVEKAIERGCRLEFEVGAIAASMGASIIAAAKARGCSVKVRKCTQLMFHGCWGNVTGGADELEDASRCMQNFNDEVIDDLMRIGVDGCEEWFVAGREKWIGAKEAVSLGIADEIIEVGEEVVDDNKVTVANRFAAKWNGGHMAEESNKAEQTEPASEPVNVEDAVNADASDTTDAAAENVNDDNDTSISDMITRIEADARVSGMQSAMQKQVNDLRIQLGDAMEELKTAKAEITSLNGKLKTYEHEKQELTDQVTSLADQLQAKDIALATLNAGVLTPNNKPSREEALAKAKSAEERMAIRAEYAKKER